MPVTGQKSWAGPGYRNLVGTLLGSPATVTRKCQCQVRPKLSFEQPIIVPRASTRAVTPTESGARGRDSAAAAASRDAAADAGGGWQVTSRAATRR